MIEEKVVKQEGLVLIGFIKEQKRLVKNIVEASQSGDIKEIYSLINELSNNDDCFEQNLEGIEGLFKHQFIKEK